MKIKYTLIDISGNRRDITEMFTQWSLTRGPDHHYSRIEAETKDGRFISGFVDCYAVRAGEFELQEVDAEIAKAANLAAELQFVDDTTVKWSWKGRA